MTVTMLIRPGFVVMNDKFRHKMLVSQEVIPADGEILTRNYGEILLDGIISGSFIEINYRELRSTDVVKGEESEEELEEEQIPIVQPARPTSSSNQLVNNSSTSDSRS